MSTISDVENAMCNIIRPAMYPNGTSQNSIAGAGVNIYVQPGDFLKANLDQDLLAGHIFVSVFAVNGMTRSTTRLRRQDVDQVINAPNLTLTVSGDTVTVGGTISVGEAAMVITGNVGYAAGVVLGSTLDSIASVLAAQIPSATVINNVVTVPNAFDLIARVSVQGTARQIYFSREAVFRARVIAPSNAKRELVGDVIELAFGRNGYYMPMPDLISASIKPNRVMEVNMFELSNATMRDYLFLVEYHTVDVQTYNTITDPYIVETVGVIPIN